MQPQTHTGPALTTWSGRRKLQNRVRRNLTQSVEIGQVVPSMVLMKSMHESDRSRSECEVRDRSAACAAFAIAIYALENGSFT